MNYIGNEGELRLQEINEDEDLKREGDHIINGVDREQGRGKSWHWDKKISSSGPQCPQIAGGVKHIIKRI